MRPLRRALFRLGVVLGICVVGIGGMGWLFARRSLPQNSGALDLEGPKDRIEIIRDVDGVPHIYAAERSDLFFGLGYVHAQDRLWQMEFQRRAGQGRLSELLGEATLSPDRYLRTLGVYRAAQADWAQLTPSTRATIDAYVAGINAFISTAPLGGLPPEFTLLGAQPELWSGPDVLVWIKMVAFDLGGDVEAELLRHDIAATLGVTRTYALMPASVQEAPALAAVVPPSTDLRRLAAATVDVRELLDTIGLSGAGLGSNAWVVDGTRSTTGAPLLANDPHLSSRTPLLWYQVHLSGGGIEVVGASIPGLPGVVVGRNRSIAWGITNLRADAQDLIHERLDPSGRFAEFDGLMEPMQVFTETIKVKGHPDVQQLVRVTRHGPLISDAINADDAALPDAVRPPPLEPLALRWTALEPNDTTMAGLLGINEAQTWQEFRANLHLLVAPAQYIIYADAAGNIGAAAAGRVPIRKGYDGSLPVAGWTSAFGWDGSVPFDALPHMYNPTSHIIVAANNYPQAQATIERLRGDWAPSYRAERIYELLQSKQQFSADDFTAFQGDLVSLQARQMLPILLAYARPDDSTAAQALDLLGHWDFTTSTDSVAATLWAAWLSKLPTVLLSDELNPYTLDQYSAHYGYLSAFLAQTLAQPASPWCDDTRTTAREDCAIAVNQALGAALADLRRTLGSDMSSWQWGKIHYVRFAHMPFSAVPLAGRVFDRTTPHGGDWSTVNVGPFPFHMPFVQAHIAAYRQISDLSGTDRDRFIIALGQSGHLLSAHYDDHLPDWQALGYRPTRLERTAVESAAQATLWLQPRSER